MARGNTEIAGQHFVIKSQQYANTLSDNWVYLFQWGERALRPLMMRRKVSE